GEVTGRPGAVQRRDLWMFGPRLPYGHARRGRTMPVRLHFGRTWVPMPPTAGCDLRSVRPCPRRGRGGTTNVHACPHVADPGNPGGGPPRIGWTARRRCRRRGGPRRAGG